MTQISLILQDNALNYNNNNNNNNNNVLFCITAAFSHMYHQFPNAHSLLFLAHSDTHNTTPNKRHDGLQVPQSATDCPEQYNKQQ
jgi:hypothetical protein